LIGWLLDLLKRGMAPSLRACHAQFFRGIGRGSTIASGEFLTDSADQVQLQCAAQVAGDKKNMEIVLSTQIIDGEPGSPKMEAVYFW
jgi:hypothetical protein